MCEHICEENIEENYETFDIIENDLMRARPQPIPASHLHQRLEQSFPSRDDQRSLIEKIDQKFFNHESKVALNSDVDLIKTTRIPYAKPTADAAEDDKVSGE